MRQRLDLLADPGTFRETGALAGRPEWDGNELKKLTPTIDALLTPDIDESLDDQPSKTRFWNAFKHLGDWWASLPPY